jgi:hypothetical protein
MTSSIRFIKEKPSTVKRLLFSICFIVIGLVVVLGYFLMRDSNREQISNTQYLTNNNSVVCDYITKDTLQCENVLTGELQRFVIPNPYREASNITPSFDGTKILVERWDEDPVITDAGFKEIRKLTRVKNDSCCEGYVWAGKSEMVLYSRPVKGEKDMAGIYSINIKTGEQKLILKTEANKNVRIIGANETYLFVIWNSLYNWGAKEAQASPDVINAIRLADGYVREVNSHQVDFTSNNVQVTTNDSTVSYDDSRDLFVFSGLKATSSEYYLMFAKLVENQYGLVLDRVYSSSLTDSGPASMLFTSKGMYVPKTTAKQFPYTLVSDDGSKTELKLAVGGDMLTSLSAMPNLPKAKTVTPAIEEFITAPKDTPARVLSFLESLVNCGTNEYSQVQLDNLVGVEQLAILGGCGNAGAKYYILKNGKYEGVLETVEGISCEERDKAGLSPKLVGCLKPGENL